MIKKLPESLREQLSRAGKARMAQLTAQERTALGRKSWQARVRRHRLAAARGWQ